MAQQKVSPVPEDFRTMTPQLIVRGVASAIEFYRGAFSASEFSRTLAPDGASIMHAEILLGDSRFFVHDEFPDWDKLSPLSIGGCSVTFHLYVEDADAIFDQAVRAGAEVLMPLENAFWGDRYGILKDPFGHHWSIASRLEDLSPREVQVRAKAFTQSAGRNNERERE